MRDSTREEHFVPPRLSVPFRWTIRLDNAVIAVAIFYGPLNPDSPFESFAINYLEIRPFHCTVRSHRFPLVSFRLLSIDMKHEQTYGSCTASTMS